MQAYTVMPVYYCNLQMPKDLSASKGEQHRVHQLLHPLPPANSLQTQHTRNWVPCLVALPAYSSCLFSPPSLRLYCFFHYLYSAVCEATLWSWPQHSTQWKHLLLACKLSNLVSETACLAVVLLWVRGWTETPEVSGSWVEFATLPNHIAGAA